MALGALFALFHLFKIKNKWARYLTLAYIISVGLSFVQSPIIQLDAYYLFCLLSAGSLLYAFSMPDFDTKKKAIISSITILATLPNFLIISETFVTNPDIFFLVSLASIIPVGIYLYVLLKERNEYINEHGFLTILAVNAGISFFTTLLFF